MRVDRVSKRRRSPLWVTLAVTALPAALLAGAARGQVWAPGNVLLTSPARSAENHFGADSHFGQSLAVGDFDGDGRDDLAVGEPAAWLGDLCCQGAVTVFLSGPGRTFTVLTHWRGFLDEDGESTGWSLAAGNFDGSGPDELAVGIPHHDDGLFADTGAVAILFFEGDGVVTQLLGEADFALEPQAGEAFGSTMAVGDFDGDGKDDLAVGAPYADNKSWTDSGRIFFFYGGNVGLVPGAYPHASADTGEVDAHLGAALAAGDFDGDGFDDLAVGVPNRVVNAHPGAGQVEVFVGSIDGLSNAPLFEFDDGSTGQNVEDGDHFGASLAAGDFNGHLGCSILLDCADDLAIGAPDEDVSSAANAGQLTVLYGIHGVGLSTASAQHFTQSALGNVEAGDGFATNLTAGKLDSSSDTTLPGAADDLVIGVPFEDVGNIQDAGVAYLFTGSQGGLSTARSQVQEAFPEYAVGPPTAGDAFGNPVAIGDFDGDGRGDIAVGVWSRWLGGYSAVGAVQVLFGGLCSDGFERGDTSNWRQSP